MKANEAPEKIYLQQNTTTDCYSEFWPEWFEARAKDSDIEYIRTDLLREILLSDVLPYFMNGGEADEVVAKLEEVIGNINK